MYLFDTNLISELRRPDRIEPVVARWAKTFPEEAIFVSVVTLYEIERGIRLKQRRDPMQGAMLAAWFAGEVVSRHADRILPVDEPVARAAAALHIPDPRPIADAFLAATAIVYGLTLVTRNARDFAGTGAALFDPWAE